MWTGALRHKGLRRPRQFQKVFPECSFFLSQQIPYQSVYLDQTTVFSLRMTFIDGARFISFVSQSNVSTNGIVCLIHVPSFRRTRMVCFVGIANFSCKICVSPDRCQRLPHTMPISVLNVIVRYLVWKRLRGDTFRVLDCLFRASTIIRIGRAGCRFMPTDVGSIVLAGVSKGGLIPCRAGFI